MDGITCKAGLYRFVSPGMRVRSYAELHCLYVTVLASVQPSLDLWTASLQAAASLVLNVPARSLSVRRNCGAGTAPIPSLNACKGCWLSEEALQAARADKSR